MSAVAVCHVHQTILDDIDVKELADDFVSPLQTKKGYLARGIGEHRPTFSVMTSESVDWMDACFIVLYLYITLAAFSGKHCASLWC